MRSPHSVLEGAMAQLYPTGVAGWGYPGILQWASWPSLLTMRGERQQVQLRLEWIPSCLGSFRGFCCPGGGQDPVFLWSLRPYLLLLADCLSAWQPFV